jgi:hypothetical protein
MSKNLMGYVPFAMNIPVEIVSVMDIALIGNFFNLKGLYSVPVAPKELGTLQAGKEKALYRTRYTKFYYRYTDFIRIVKLATIKSGSIPRVKLCYPAEKFLRCDPAVIDGYAEIIDRLRVVIVIYEAA